MVRIFVFVGCADLRTLQIQICCAPYKYKYAHLQIQICAPTNTNMRTYKYKYAHLQIQICAPYKYKYTHPKYAHPKYAHPTNISINHFTIQPALNRTAPYF